jgi:hypothetical protein
MRHDKSPSFYNPIETTMVDDIPFTHREKFVRDQRTVALLIVENVADDQERSDFLEMIGIKPYPRKDLHEERNKAKRVYKHERNNHTDDA